MSYALIVNVGSANHLPPAQYGTQTNVDLLSIEPLGINYIKIAYICS